MLSRTRGLARVTALLAASAAHTRHMLGNRQLMKCQSLLQYRHNSDSMFDLFDRPPIDPTKVYIDEVIKDLGDRTIKRDGSMSAQNMFKLFLLDEQYMLNESKLHREFIKLQRAFHPDRYQHKDVTSRIASEQLSALINEAYSTLKHPYKRAIYLLRLKTNKSALDIEESLDDLKMEPEFLTRMMEIREKIDGICDRAQQYRLLQELQVELDELTLSLSKDFTSEDYKSVLKKLGKLKFVANCHVKLSERVGGYSNF